jgi:hypothetical protein
MEPLSEIDSKFFYSYVDDKKFVYGFDVMSLIQLMKNKTKIANPYNRDYIEPPQKTDILSLFYKLKIVFLEDIRENYPHILSIDPYTLNMCKDRNCMRRPVIRHRLANHIVDAGTGTGTGIATESIAINQTNELIREHTEPQFLGIPFVNQINALEELNITIPQINETIDKIREIRAKPLNTRIQELFIEIDILGNYTQAAWFEHLDRVQLIHLYRNLYDIWIYRSQMVPQMRMSIYPLGNLFRRVLLPSHFRTMTTTQIQTICIEVMENMVFCGIDIEHRKIGTLHMLSAMTIVSGEARLAMPWLYDSVA